MRIRSASALALVAAGALGAVPAAPADEPDFPAKPAAIVEYRESGEWDEDLDTQTGRARDHLEAYLADSKPSKPAIVLDVDDTSLSSYDCLEPVDFDRSAVGDSCVRKASLPAIPQTLALFRRARELDVTVIFITGRRARLREATKDNLRAEGYTGSWKLELRPDRQRRSLRDGWKARVRRKYTRQGYKIVANVGDQRSDLDGGYAVRKFKLPNPMYLIREA